MEDEVEDGKIKALLNSEDVLRAIHGSGSGVVRKVPGEERVISSEYEELLLYRICEEGDEYVEEFNIALLDVTVS